LRRLTSDLLDAARLEGGVFAVYPQPVELVALARETVASVNVGERRVSVRAPDHLEVCLDPERIRQVLENLLSNALRHSPEGTPVDIHIRTEARDGGEWVVLTIRNDGDGVPPDLLPRLFTRFTADSRSAGVGLGLYIARKIVELHEGAITVDSAPGQGAEFHVVLPLAEPSPAAAR
jgi:two-component system, OmpR family, sensor kinase